MLELGVFGGWYFGKDYAEYPSTWFRNAKISTNGFDESLAMGVIAAKGIAPLKDALIKEPDDLVKAASAWTLG